MNNPNLDSSIPVLTEVIPVLTEEIPEQRDASAPLPEPEVVAATPYPVITEHQPTLLEQAVREWNEETWDLLEREIRERVLYQVMEHIEEALEQRVRDSLADVLQTAVDGLASDLKGGLQNTVKDVVTRAVAQQISNLQTAKK
jgi:hypothetical protein